MTLDQLLPRIVEAGSFMVRAAALVLILYLASRIPVFRSLFYKRDLDQRGQVLFSLFWIAASILAPGLTVISAFVPFFAGLFGNVLVGYTVGAAAGASMAFQGFSVPCVLVHVLAGCAGGLMGRTIGPGRRLPLGVALAAGVLAVVGFDVPDHRGTWLPLAAIMGGPALWMVQMPYLAAAFSLACLLFMRVLEYMFTEEERDRARTADRVLLLAQDAARVLGAGLDAEAARSLAPLVRAALEVPAAFIQRAGWVAFDGLHPHDPWRAGAPAEGEVDHREVFGACPAGCRYTAVRLVPLRDGEQTVGVLGILRTRTAAFSPSVASTVQGLAALLSGRLSEVRVGEQKSRLEEARWRFLQAQIQPHFLFNALNTIAAVSRQDPDAVRDLVLHLARFLRESFQQDQPLSPLQRELDIVRSYLVIEQARFGERLRVVLDVPDPLPECHLPSFTLQPLVENAVRHGLGGGGEVRISVSPGPASIEIAISDTGCGMEADRLLLVARGMAPGVGFANVRERLLAHYGDRAALEVQSAPGEGTRITLVVPAEVPLPC